VNLECDQHNQCRVKVKRLNYISYRLYDPVYMLGESADERDDMGSIKIRRQFPNPRELGQILRFQNPFIFGRQATLNKALTIYDLRDLAKKKTPKAPFDYTDGAADSEISLKAARNFYEHIHFTPSVLQDVSDVDISTTMLGENSKMPFGIAPTGFTRMMQTEGELAGAVSARDFGIPFTLSTMGTRSIEEVAAVTPDGKNLFQLYMWKDREKSLALVDRAYKAGINTLVLTVDVPVAGERLRDIRNGMTIPPTLTSSTVLNAIPRFNWWFNLLTTEPLTFASLASWKGTVAQLIDQMFDPTITFDDLKWIRENWKGKLIVKGIQNIDDAVKSVDFGADAILISNHGGRQLDRAPIPLLLLPKVVKRVGKSAEVHIDTGIMHGGDIVTAIALGADFAWIGRAYLYGLMAGGKEGVDRSLEILRSQMIRTMQLLGVRTLSELNPSHVEINAPAG
jgi:L-lactate dehydrogenase (cytochrome)